MRWWILVAVGCQQGATPPPPPVAKSVVVDAVPVDAAPDAPPDAMDSLRDALTKLAADEDPIDVCFAASANRRRVACMKQAPDSLRAGRTVQILGDTGDLKSEWVVRNGDVIDELRGTLARRKYQAFDPARIALNGTDTVGDHELRRERKPWKSAAIMWDGAPGPDAYDDHVELACGSRWVDVPLGDLQIEFGEYVAIDASVFDDRRILLEVSGGVSVEEGDPGIWRGAMLIDTVALCR
jgi:hypothetical protein